MRAIKRVALRYFIPLEEDVGATVGSAWAVPTSFGKEKK